MTTHSITQAQFEWLRGEVRGWQQEALITPPVAEAILSRYSPALVSGPGHQAVSGRLSVPRLFGLLGGAFVGVGLIWLVAANLDQLSPLVRFVFVTALWLSVTVGAEVYAARHRQSVLVGGLRLVAALGFGAVIFQAAQSLQLPEYSPHLVGLWSAGVLVYAYALRSLSGLLVGVTTFSIWAIGSQLWRVNSFLGVVAALSILGVLMLVTGSVQDRALPRFAWLWRLGGVGFLLVALFAAGVPAEPGSLHVTWTLVVLGVLSVLLALVVAVRGTKLARLELLGAVATIAAAFVLAWWDVGSDPVNVDVVSWAHAGLCVLAYVALAVGVATLGTLRDEPVLTGLAAIALVIFTTFQSFAVFARIIQGAWLFVVLGLVFLGTAWLFDRTRRAIAQELGTASPDPQVASLPDSTSKENQS